MGEVNLIPVVRHLQRLAGLPGDAELLERFVRRQDADAFAVLVGRHGPLVWRTCRRLLHHEQDAEDAWQATFLLLARKAGSIRRPAALAAWLHATAGHVAHKARAARERRLADKQRRSEIKRLRRPTDD